MLLPVPLYHLLPRSPLYVRTTIVLLVTIAMPHTIALFRPANYEPREMHPVGPICRIWWPSQGGDGTWVGLCPTSAIQLWIQCVIHLYLIMLQLNIQSDLLPNLWPAPSSAWHPCCDPVAYDIQPVAVIWVCKAWQIPLKVSWTHRVWSVCRSQPLDPVSTNNDKANTWDCTAWNFWAYDPHWSMHDVVLPVKDPCTSVWKMMCLWPS